MWYGLIFLLQKQNFRYMKVWKSSPYACKSACFTFNFLFYLLTVGFMTALRLNSIHLFISSNDNNYFDIRKKVHCFWAVKRVRDYFLYAIALYIVELLMLVNMHSSQQTFIMDMRLVCIQPVKNRKFRIWAKVNH